jgi:hypothetical protein
VIPSARHALPLLAAVVLVAGACAATPSGGSGADPSPPIATPSPSTPTPPVGTPTTPPGTPTLPPTGSQPPTGNTDTRFPELAVSSGGPGWMVELTDPTAKAWRLVVAGADPADRLELLVETGDVWPGVMITSIVDDAVVEEHDLTQMVGDATAAAGGCHPVLEVCYSSDGILVDLEGGRVGLVVEHIDSGAFTFSGASAGWPAEPFVLGPWRTTAPFTTGG